MTDSPTDPTVTLFIIALAIVLPFAFVFSRARRRGDGPMAPVIGLGLLLAVAYWVALVLFESPELTFQDRLLGVGDYALAFLAVWTVSATIGIAVARALRPRVRR